MLRHDPRARPLLNKVVPDHAFSDLRTATAMENESMDRKSLILAKVMMTFLMALLMSGIMSMLALGPTEIWLRNWPKDFLIAWPIAFLLTNVVSRIVFPAAARLARYI